MNVPACALMSDGKKWLVHQVEARSSSLDC